LPHHQSKQVVSSIVTYIAKKMTSNLDTCAYDIQQIRILMPTYTLCA